MKSPKREGDLLVEWAALCLIVSSEEVAARCACRHCALALKIEDVCESPKSGSPRSANCFSSLSCDTLLPPLLLVEVEWWRVAGGLLVVGSWKWEVSGFLNVNGPVQC